MTSALGFEGIPRRPVGRRSFLRGGVAVGAAGAAIYAVGCGSNDDSDSGRSPTPMGNAGGIKPVLLTGDFVAGQNNRFAVGLLDDDNNLITDASVHVRFFAVAANGSTGTLQAEGDLTPLELNVEGAHIHDGSSGDALKVESIAFYVANPRFVTAGRWGVEIGVTPASGRASTVQVPFEVLDTSQTPGVGALPPASRNDTAATVAEGSMICSRDPVCPFHDKVIGDVLGKGRPLVVQFSTPAFCETRFCGPVLEALLSQAPLYKDRIDFVHIEVWEDFAAQRQRRTVAEWNLPGEPYTFFMDKDGRVFAKLEAIFSEEELAGVLQALALRS